jgi:hypothetical protein
MAQKTGVNSLLLFDLRTDYGPADVIWSHSRRSSLEQCPRRYYYDYFGASSRLAAHEPLKLRLRFLKSLQGRHERAGTIVHQLISNWLRRAQKGERWSADRLAKWGRQVFQRDRQFSARWPDGGQAGRNEEKFPPVLLQEFHYRDKNAQQDCDETETRIGSGLEAFAGAPAFEAFRSGGAQAGSRIEEGFHVEGLPCRTNGRVDLAFCTGNSTTVADWKLGASDGTGATSLQLAAYSMWARQQFPQTSDVRVFKAFLADAVAREFAVTVELEAAVRARIVQDAQRMAVLQRYGVEGQSDAFTACAQPRICALCKYRSVCPEGSSCRES